MSLFLPSRVESVALNIKDPETDRLARELAIATGESITVAARRAIEERLARVRATRRPGQRDEIDAIAARPGANGAGTRARGGRQPSTGKFSS